MHLTLDDLIKHATHLQQQLEAASAMVQQTAGALSFVNNQIKLLKKTKESSEQSTEHEE